MKFIILVFISLISTSAFSADWNTLKHAAETNLLHRSVVINGAASQYDYETLPVTSLELNRVDNPFATANALIVSLAGADWVEIFLQTPREEVNCYALFVNGVFDSIQQCRYRVK